jgi:hypothetical protein
MTPASGNSQRLRYRQLLFVEGFGLGSQFGQVLGIGSSAFSSFRMRWPLSRQDGPGGLGQVGGLD